MKSSVFYRIGFTLSLVAALALIALASYLAFTNLGHYNDGYDEGVYLESARLMDRGFPMYKAVFDSQAPLWLVLVDVGFKLAGESVRSGRLPVAAGFVVAVVAVIWAGWELRGRWAGLLAGAIVMLSPMFLRFARMAEADVPAAGFGALGIACAARYANVGRRRWLILAALAVTASTLTKLLGIYTFLTIAVLICARWASQTPDWRARFRAMAVDVAIVSGIFLGITALCFLFLGPRQVWDQAIAFHLVARDANHSAWLVGHVHDLVNYFHLEPLIVPGLPLIFFALFGRWRGLAVLSWLAFSAAGLINQEPLQDHQVVALVAPLALAIGFGWGQLWSAAFAFGKWSRRPDGKHAWIGTVGIILVVVLAGGSLVRLVRDARPAWAGLQAIDAHSEEDAINLRVAPIVLAHSSPKDFILTDQQTVTNWLNRDVPPGLVDTSFVRIDTGYLTTPEVIHESTQYHVKMVVLESGRLDKLPGLVDWVKRTFPNHQDVGDGRVVYWR